MGMDTFPAYFPLKGRRLVIAGDGWGAEAKARLLAGSPATITRVTGEACADPATYAGAALIFLADDDVDALALAVAAARTAGAPLNVVDHPELSDFHTPAIVDRGAVVAAVGTAGAAPLLASLIRAEMELRVTPAAGVIAGLLGARRDALRDALPDLPRRRAFLRAALSGPIAEAAATGALDLAGQRLDAAIAGGFEAPGRVHVITAPAAPDLLSVRAVRALNAADIVVAGEGSEAILAAHARRDAEYWSPASADMETLGRAARAGRLIALVGDGFEAALIGALEDARLAVERHAPAPPP
jgi:precorrin-2 dehydrogenase/sirohydrochlorin ferrochelatase